MTQATNGPIPPDGPLIRLRNGDTTEDARLDRLIQFDERSRGYPIREIVERKPRSYTWRLDGPIIDQGPDGACVGFAVTNELQARPAEVFLPSLLDGNRFAKEQVYWPAQKIDPWPGGSYPNASPKYEGTSVLAGIKIAHQLGYFREYRWSFSLEDFCYGIGHNGPAVIGIWWRYGMFRPDSKGFIRYTGDRAGGHAVLVRAIKIVWKDPDGPKTWANVDLDRSYVTIRNSWGRGWGLLGDCYMTLRDLGQALAEQGEAVFAVRRTWAV